MTERARSGVERGRGGVALVTRIALGMLAACGGEAATPAGPASTATPSVSQPPAATDSSGSSASSPNNTAAPIPAASNPNSGGTAGQPPAAPGSSAAGTPGAGAAPAASSGAALPQEVCRVLQNNGCISCHQERLQGGAPMTLQWRADFAGKAKDGTDMAAKLIARVTDAKAPMPPVTTMRPLMSAEHVEVLRSWIQSGMDGVIGTACEDSGEADPTTPSWARAPWPAEECEYTLTVGAHATSGTPFAQDALPYAPPAVETSYHCFYEQVPWGDQPVQALATRIRLDGKDDNAVVHHLVVSALGANEGMSILGGAPPTAAGQHQDCPNPSGSTVAVWAPGPHTQVTFPKDVGVLMPSGAKAFIELQVHYNNVTAGMNSRVAVDICATSKMRPNTAAVHWLGFDNALEAIPLEVLGPEFQPALDNQGGGVAIGTCKAKQRARVLWMAPHMHERGRHAKVELVGQNGTRTIHDGPFDFREQTAYFYDDLWLDAGDSVRTTCTWDSKDKVVFGFASNQEMCFVYTLAYPVGALSGQGAEKGVTGGNLNCAGSP